MQRQNQKTAERRKRRRRILVFCLCQWLSISNRSVFVIVFCRFLFFFTFHVLLELISDTTFDQMIGPVPEQVLNCTYYIYSGSSWAISAKHANKQIIGTIPCCRFCLVDYVRSVRLHWQTGHNGFLIPTTEPTNENGVFIHSLKN